MARRFIFQKNHYSKKKKKNKTKQKSTGGADMASIGVGACRADGGSDGAEQVEGAAALAAASSLVIVL